MKDWLKEAGAGRGLPAAAAEELHDSGFVVIPGPVAGDRLPQFARAYDSAVAGAVPPDFCRSPSGDG